MNVIFAEGVIRGPASPLLTKAIAWYNNRMVLRRTSHAVYDTKDRLVWCEVSIGMSAKIIWASWQLSFSVR